MVKKISDVPEGIKIISFIYFVVSVGLAMIIPLVFAFADRLRIDGGASLIGTPIVGLDYNSVVLLGIFMVSLVILGYLIGRDLLKGKNWTRIVLGIFLAIGIIMSFNGFRDGLIIGGIFKILLNGFILWYLFIKESTKKFFK
tara:strand:- start:13397 stop:13822 length:426 start_codon:yes stop_codon:yes gene_type:complete